MLMNKRGDGLYLNLSIPGLRNVGRGSPPFAMPGWDTLLVIFGGHQGYSTLVCLEILILGPDERIANNYKHVWLMI
jgi:hypothetical protein